MFEYLNPADCPVVEGFPEVVYAKDQPQYRPLRTMRSSGGQGRVMSRWTLTPEQRKAVAEGADIFLTLLTFHQRLQPIMLAVGDRPDDKCLEHFAQPEPIGIGVAIPIPDEEAMKAGRDEKPWEMKKCGEL